MGDDYKRGAYKRLMKAYKRKVGWYLTLVVSNHISFTLGYFTRYFPSEHNKKTKTDICSQVSDAKLCSE